MSVPGSAAGDSDGLRYGSRAARWVLLSTVLGSAMASIDATVVGIALPTIGREFHTSLATLQWVVTAYMLTLAGLLLFAGALGDKYGRKRIFLIGVAWFAVASALCAVAPNAPVLVGARAFQGIGAALLTPGSLAIIEASFRADDRSRAIGAWSGFAGVGTAIGPFLGGWLIQAYSWRLIFLINLPLAAIVMMVGWRHVPETRNLDATGKVDFTGATLVTLGLIGLTYGLIEGPSRGWGSTGPAAFAYRWRGSAGRVRGLGTAGRRADADAEPVQVCPVRLGQCGDVRGVCRPRRRASSCCRFSSSRSRGIRRCRPVYRCCR